MPTRDPCLLPGRGPTDRRLALGHPVLDRYLEFVAARARVNTVLATASDLRVFRGNDGLSWPHLEP